MKTERKKNEEDEKNRSLSLFFIFDFFFSPSSSHLLSLLLRPLKSSKKNMAAEQVRFLSLFLLFLLVMLENRSRSLLSRSAKPQRRPKTLETEEWKNDAFALIPLIVSSRKNKNSNWFLRGSAATPSSPRRPLLLHQSTTR